MAYHERGEGRPILFFHDGITSEWIKEVFGCEFKRGDKYSRSSFSSTNQAIWEVLMAPSR